MKESITKKNWTDPNGKVHEGLVDQVIDGFSVISCDCCRFKHVVPLPTPKELETIYSNEYYSQEKPLYITRYLEDKVWWDAVYADRYDILEGYLGRQNGSILDVGSGPGLFLALGQTRGWTVKGIEPSSQAAKYSREILNLDIENIFLDSNTSQGMGQFDVINMGEVLEHLPDPEEMLQIVKGLIKKNGILTLVVPNDFNPLQLILRDHLNFDPWWVAPPHHLNYFDHNSLKSLVQKVGFEVLHMDSTFPIDMFLMMGRNYIGNDSLGRDVHNLSKAFDLNLINSGSRELRQKLYCAFAKLGIGREIVLYARNLD